MCTKNKKIKHSKISGFTLIELLVVISIIALLSTVVFAAVGDARVKARNAARNSLVLEYVKALELYRGENTSYPSAGTGSETSKKCVGYTESETCYLEGYTGSNTINSAFLNYIKGSFADKTPVLVGASNFNGIQYTCTDLSCSSYQLIWVLENQNTNCVSGAIKINFFIHTRCTLTQ